MLESFFSFIRRRTSFSCSARDTISRALKSKKEYAKLYLKMAKALQPHCPEQAAIFTEMRTKELENYQKLLSFSCNGCTKGMAYPCTLGSFLDPLPSGGSSLTSHKKRTSRQTILTWIQPGLAGLMDGSVSTLAPIFAAAFATGDTHQTFMIGLSASIGAGLSMGFTEAAHDDGKLSGRGSPIKRGFASGIMTTLGGMGHTLPYLIDSFYVATLVAFITVFFELCAIVWIQHQYMSTPFWRASLQVLIGGALVFATGVFIGNL